jgi:hypothetical protein
MTKTSKLFKTDNMYSRFCSLGLPKKYLRAKFSCGLVYIIVTATLLGSHTSYAATDACTTSDGGVTYTCSTQNNAQTQTITATGATTISVSSGSSILYQSSQASGLTVNGANNDITIQSPSSSNLIDVQSSLGNVITATTSSGNISIGGSGSFQGALKAVGGDGFNLSTTNGAITAQLLETYQLLTRVIFQLWLDLLEMV